MRLPEKPLTEIKWDAESAEKGGYEHFMLKEIHEQPKVVRDTINSVVTDNTVHFDAVNLTDAEMQEIEQVYIVACGSAYHVGVAVQYVIEALTSLQVRVELASEFRYRKMTLRKKSLMIVISQSVLRFIWSMMPLRRLRPDARERLSSSRIWRCLCLSTGGMIANNSP